MSYKDQFIDIYNQYVKREGASKLLAYLESTDFFTAPASTKFHLAHEMGLCEHSLNVYYRLKDLVKNEKSDWANKISDETIAIVALLHDVCKADMYVVDYRNQKQPDGSWVKVPYYTIDENGHYIVDPNLTIAQISPAILNLYDVVNDALIRIDALVKQP